MHIGSLCHTYNYNYIDTVCSLSLSIIFIKILLKVKKVIICFFAFTQREFAISLQKFPTRDKTYKEARSCITV